MTYLLASGPSPNAFKISRIRCLNWHNSIWWTLYNSRSMSSAERTHGTRCASPCPPEPHPSRAGHPPDQCTPACSRPTLVPKLYGGGGAVACAQPRFSSFAPDLRSDEPSRPSSLRGGLSLQAGRFSPRRYLSVRAASGATPPQPCTAPPSACASAPSAPPCARRAAPGLRSSSRGRRPRRSSRR